MGNFLIRNYEKVFYKVKIKKGGKMKRTANIFLLILITLLLISCGKVTEQQARQALDKHLKNKYGEEYEIGYMGRRAIRDKEFYQAEIYPKKYNGTEKEYDKYYKANGTVVLKNILSIEKIGFVGDTYGIVKINEAANEFYGKKLKELFGENVLPVFDILFNYDMQEPTMEKIIEHSKKEGKSITIKGGIYIFGRVENDEDREWYRKQIYEFIQFMKETGTFEYVDLAFYILDERILTKGFEKITPSLIKKIEKCKNSKDFIDYREKMLSQLDNEYDQMTSEEKKEKINNYSRSAIRKFNNDSYTGYCSLYHTVVRSIKFLEVETRLSMYKKLKYNSKKDIKLLNTIQIIFKEFDEKKIYNNEWGD